MSVVNVTHRSGRGRCRSQGTSSVRGLALAFGLAMLAPGCAKRQIPPPPVALAEPAPRAYHVQTGDIVEVKFLYHPTDTHALPTRTHGPRALPLRVDLPLLPLTLHELEELTRPPSSRGLREPVVSVSVAEPAARAYIGGEVTNAGFVQLGKPMDVLQ